MEYVLAGHPPQLWNRDGGKNWDYVDQPRETVIGVRAGVEYPMGRLTLQPGDALLLFTDGVAEARDARGEELGYPALLQHCRQAAPDQKCGDMIMNLALWLNTYTGGVEQEDDITLLALRFRPDAGPTQENRDCGKTPS